MLTSGPKTKLKLSWSVGARCRKRVRIIACTQDTSNSNISALDPSYYLNGEFHIGLISNVSTLVDSLTGEHISYYNAPGGPE